MECSHLSAASKRRICRLMVREGLDGEVEDFDVTHYCKGNPNYCFFFRSYDNQTQATEQPKENKPDVPMVSVGSIMLNEAIQPEEPSSEQSDKLLKLKRFFHRIA